MAADRTPGNFGSRLREARERKGVSLRQIANATKISVAALEALERDDISRLPGGIFSRAFVRSYAVEVGLDPEATIRDFVAQFPQDSVTAGHATSRQLEDVEAFESDRRMVGTFLWILVVSVPIAGGMFYFGTFEHRAGQNQETPVSAPAPQANSQPSDASDPGPAALVNAAGVPIEERRPSDRAVPQPAVPVSAAPPSPAPAAQAPAAAAARDHLTVGLSARRPVWVSATVDGRKTIERLLQAGERQSIDVQGEMMITAGDASAIVMTLNGADARALGKAGEVVTVRLNLANFKEYLQTR